MAKYMYIIQSTLIDSCCGVYGVYSSKKNALTIRKQLTERAVKEATEAHKVDMVETKKRYPHDVDYCEKKFQEEIEQIKTSMVIKQFEVNCTYQI